MSIRAQLYEWFYSDQGLSDEKKALVNMAAEIIDDLVSYGYDLVLAVDERCEGKIEGNSRLAIACNNLRNIIAKEVV